MKTQHTPGPWTVSQFCTPRASEDPLGAYLIDEIAKELGELDAKSYDAEPDSEEEQDWVDARSNKNEANARLIAAAPDLLDACKKMSESIRHAHHCNAPQAYPCTCDANALWDMSRAAIAKAGGAQ